MVSLGMRGHLRSEPIKFGMNGHIAMTEPLSIKADSCKLK